MFFAVLWRRNFFSPLRPYPLLSLPSSLPRTQHLSFSCSESLNGRRAEGEWKVHKAVHFIVIPNIWISNQSKLCVIVVTPLSSHSSSPSRRGCHSRRVELFLSLGAEGEWEKSCIHVTIEWSHCGGEGGRGRVTRRFYQLNPFQSIVLSQLSVPPETGETYGVAKRKDCGNVDFNFALGETSKVELEEWVVSSISICFSPPPSASITITIDA